MVKISKKTKLGMVQINNSFANQCYLPYSVAMLQAYAQRHLETADRFEFLPAVFDRIRVEEAVEQLESADVVCFSTYVWNVRLSLAIAEALKTQNPSVLTVFGGPQIPDDDTEGFLRRHRCIDLACHGEGDRVLKAILEHYGERNWQAVPSLSYLNDRGEFLQTEKCPRIRDFMEVPSPFLDGVFEPLIEAHPEMQWIGLWETNRGCPFECSFCDWGSKTKNKVIRRDIEEIYLEADWFSDHKIEFIFCCDANFSILKRDIDIIKRVAANKASHGYPKALSVQSTKNFTDNSYAIYKIMGESKLSKGVALALQSVHEPTLEAIYRQNIPAKAFQEAQERLSAMQIETFTDIILPLPEETYDSFVDGIAFTIGHGQHHRIQFNNLSILPNAAMGDPAYQERYAFETVETDIINIHGSMVEDNPIREKQLLVVGTSTMSQSDWVRTRVFSWMTGLLHFNKLLQIPFVLLHQLYDVSYRDLLERFTQEDLPPILAEINRVFVDKAHAIRTGDVEFCESREWLNIYWPADELMLIQLCTQDRLDAFYGEASACLADLMRRKSIVQWESVLEAAMSLNRELMKLPFQTENRQLHLHHNIWDIYRASLRGDRVPLEQGQFHYEIDRTTDTWTSWEQWCREVIWWGNKRGAYLYACNTVDSQQSILGISSHVHSEPDSVLGRSHRHDGN